MTPISVASVSAPASTRSFRLSARRRITLTATCVTAGICGTLFTTPEVVEGTPWDHWLDGLAWCLLAAAIVLRLWAASHISGRKSTTLVATGPYAISRNPLYLGTLLIAISQMLILKSWPFALSCVFPVTLYAVVVVRAEEQLLVNRLGAAYLNYCRQVPRWTPSWSALNFQWGRPENWAAFRAECVRCAWWLLLPFASEFVVGVREWIWSAGWSY